MENRNLERSGGQGRHAWLDHARGIGIILVVYAHQMRAQAATGQMPVSWGGPSQDALIYSFHMPLFFFISGIVSVRSLEKNPILVSLMEKIKNIAYPYFLWSIVSWCLSALAVEYVNKPISVQSLLSISFAPILQYWFLYALFFCQLTALLFRKIFVANVVIAIIFVIAPMPFVNPTIKEFVNSFPFFVVGMMVSGFLLEPTDHRSGHRTVMTALTAAGMFAALVWFRPGSAVFPLYFALAQAWVGIIVVVSVARMIGARWTWLSTLGQASMAIYVMHTIVAAGIRTILGILGLQDPLMILFGCVLGGLIVPLIVVRIAAAYRLEPWFGLGKSARPIIKTERISVSTVP